jgi:hypothetical protein
MDGVESFLNTMQIDTRSHVLFFSLLHVNGCRIEDGMALGFTCTHTQTSRKTLRCDISNHKGPRTWLRTLTCATSVLAAPTI